MSEFKEEIDVTVNNKIFKNALHIDIFDYISDLKKGLLCKPKTRGGYETFEEMEIGTMDFVSIDLLSYAKEQYLASNINILKLSFRNRVLKMKSWEDHGVVLSKIII